MTRLQQRFLDRAVKIIAKKCAGAPEEIIRRVANEEIERAMEYADIDQAELGTTVSDEPISLPPRNLPQPVFPAPAAMPDAEPEPKHRQKRQILMPGEEGFASAAAGKTKLIGRPVKLGLFNSQTDSALPPEQYQRKWQAAINTLNNLVSANMPPTLDIVPNGTSSTLTIHRLNVQSEVVAGLVKAEYGIPGQNRGAANHASEEAFPIDRVVSTMWSIEDNETNWQQRIQDVCIQAQDVFRPRPETIVSRTPVKTGPVDMLLSGDPRNNAGGYIEIDNKDHALGVTFDSAKSAAPAKKRPRGPIVPSL